MDGNLLIKSIMIDIIFLSANFLAVHDSYMYNIACEKKKK